MRRIYILCFSLFTLVLQSACMPTITKIEAFPEMYQERPVSILVLPVINMTTAADAKEYYMTTIVEPLSLAGYYVYPIEVTSDILKAEGIYDVELLVNQPPQLFKQHFGADAVMYIKLLKWDTNYYIIGGNVTVAVDCLLKSTTTAKDLWKYDGQMVLDTSGDSGGAGGVTGLLIKAVATAVQTAGADYVPIAKRANVITMSSMPYGKYHSGYDTDKNMNIIHKNKKDETVE